MAIAYDTQHQLDHLLTSGGLDLSVRNAIIQYLMDDGILTGGTKVWVQNDHLPLDSTAQVLLLNSPVSSVHTDSTLKVIVDTGDAQLTVKGPNDVLVATGDGVNLIDMKGTSGNDVVIAGGGANTIDGSHGSHGHDNAYGSHGHDNDYGSHGHDNSWGDGDHHTMDGGNHGSGDHGDTTTVLAGSGNDTITGEHGNYLFEVGFHNEGNATITGSSGGVNTVDFEGKQDTLANATITTAHGVTTVDFKDGQDYTLTNIEHLDFHK